MVIEDLEKNISLRDVKVILPDDVFEWASQHDNLKQKEVWLYGHLMGDFFVKINREDTKVYPLFRTEIHWDEIKEWEVIEVFNT